MDFKVILKNSPIQDFEKNVAYLQVEDWNDFSYRTMFSLTVYDEDGFSHDLGYVKIGYKGQRPRQPTSDKIGNSFPFLPPDCFSLGTDFSYYQTIQNDLSEQSRKSLLTGLNDIVFNPEIFDSAKNEDVLSTSLLRVVSLATIEGQFKRVLQGKAPLTPFDFIYTQKANENNDGLELTFTVSPESKPSTNIHAIIGRNGVGKTTLLNGMIKAIVDKNHRASQFSESTLGAPMPIRKTYFSSLVSVSFSIFDTAPRQEEQSVASVGTCYYYIGLKNISKDKDTALPSFKNIAELHKEFFENLNLCMSQSAKKQRWLTAIEALESDENFATMNLANWANLTAEDQLRDAALPVVCSMSSGHAIVFIIITNLVATVEEKTLVLIDEPETHLHPPLLSAFIRALSDLLHDRNGVAIVATHSPVVLQEMPKSCVWNVIRSGAALAAKRPDIETFGENVGILTREVFGLEVTKSGFHQLLKQAVAQGSSFDQIMSEYNNQLGFEAQAILRALVHDRDRKAVS